MMHLSNKRAFHVSTDDQFKQIYSHEFHSPSPAGKSGTAK